MSDSVRVLGSLNALCAPVAPGNRVRVGDALFLCDTDMRGRWKVYRNHGENGAVRWKIEQEGLDGQIALLAWLEAQGARGGV